MKVLIFVASLFLVYETSFHLVLGQTIEFINDCTKLFNFIYGDSREYGRSCCDSNAIECNKKGFITSFNNTEFTEIKYKLPDLKSFPELSLIENLRIEDVHIKEIPDSIMKLSNLKTLSFRHCKIEVIPSAIQNLTKLESLIIEGNNIKKLPNELFNLKNLKTLDLASNNIEEIPRTIQNLSKLEHLYLKGNNIKKLPSEIFNLTNLKNFHIKNNPNLKTKLINFGNSTVQYCGFDTVNVLCYESHTCHSINYDDKIIPDSETNKALKICTSEDIKGVLLQKDNNEKSNSLLIVIIVCVIVDLIGFIISFILIKKKRSKRSNKANTSFNDVFRTKKPSGYNACVRISLVVTFIIFITVAITLLIKVLIL